MAVYANQTYFFTPNYGLNSFIPIIPNHAQEELVLAGYLGGGQYNDSIAEIVPNNHSLVENVFSCAKRYFSRKIGSISPEWNKELWVNSAKTFQSLKEDAKAVAPKFIERCRTISSQFGAQANFGPEDCCPLKKAGSLRRKIISDSRGGGISIEKATQLVGDAVRGTIIVDSPEQAVSIIGKVNEWIEREGGEVGWKNFFQDERDREDGYIGIHGKILFRFKNHKDEERQILTELQLHFKSIVDGSLDSPKERMHLLYKRQKEKPNPFSPKVSKLSFLSGLSSIGNMCRLPQYFLSWCEENSVLPDDLCKDREYAYLCEGNLGIPRHLMPQLPASSTTRRDFLTKQENQNITVQKGFISADELIPTQNELSRVKVEELRKGSYDPCGGEIIVATGNANGKKYVVDGHHRYAACRLKKGMQKILAIGESIQVVLSKLFTFSGVERRDINHRKNLS